MKHCLWCCFLLCMTVCLPTQAKNKVVEYPLIFSYSTEVLDISKVELTKSATILHFDAIYRPHYWIRVSSECYLQANGKKYRLTKSEGITPDSLFWMPDSGEASFTLSFEPLPSDTESFDFLEGTDDKSWKLYGIDLTGQRLDTPPAGVPAELLPIDWNAKVPDPVFKVGTTTVKVHLLNYRPEMGSQFEAFVNDMFGNQNSYPVNVDPTTGEGTVSFLQYGPIDFFMVYNNGGLFDAKLVAGETAEFYIDARIQAYLLQTTRAERHKISGVTKFRRVYAAKSEYANLNNAINVISDDCYFDMNLHSGDFCSYKLTSAEYAAHVLKTYHSLSDSLAQSNLTPLMKDFGQLRLQQEALEAMTNGDIIRKINYQLSIHNYDRTVQIEGFDSLKIEDARSILQVVDINDTRLFMGNSLMNYATAHQAARFNWPEIAGYTKGFAYDLRRTGMYSVMATNLDITEEDFKHLKEMENPFFYEAFSQLQAKTQADLDAVVARAKVEPTPDVPLEQLFDAIIAPHKGKVVLIDFWATWCGPCRAAINEIEPLKSTELKSDDLVWIYLTDESSPLTKYMTMIPDIQGLHYRLTTQQWRQIANKFGINSIPSYVIVDKAGNYSLRNDLRDDHNAFKKGLLEELKK